MLAQLITAPTSEPITLAEAKAHLRLEHALDDTEVSSFIIAARQYVEEVCWRGLVAQTWELVAEEFPDDAGKPANAQGFELPRGNLVSVTSVKYLHATTGAETTLASTEYAVDAVSVPGRVRLAYDKSWPDHRTQWDAVRIRYVVGWAVGSVPQALKSALLLLVSQFYEHRTPEVVGSIVSKHDFAVDALLRPYRLFRPVP